MPKGSQRTLVESVLFKTAQTRSSLPGVLQQLLHTEAHGIRVQILLTKGNLAESLPKAAARRFDTGKLERLMTEDGMISAQLAATVGRQTRKVVSGRFLALRHAEHDLAWLLVTADSAEFETRILAHVVRRARPQTTRPLLRSVQIEELLKKLSRLDGVQDLRVRQVGSRTRIRSEGAVKSIESDRRWTDLTIHEAFSEARQSGQWIVDAQATYDHGRVYDAAVKVSRSGVVTFRKLVGPVFWPVIDEVVQWGVERYQFLHGRARSRDNEFRSRPFNIEFKHPVLSSKDQIEHLRHVLGSIPHVTCTSLHGNPYLHAALVDYRDGSAYEIFALSDSHITVVPQGRATVQALQRLCGKVFSDFREGNLTELHDG